MRRSNRFTFLLVPVVIFIAYLGLYSHYHYQSLDSVDLLDEEEWISTAASWRDKQKCSWLGFCGAGEWETSSTPSREPVEPHGKPVEDWTALSEEAKATKFKVHPFWTSGEDDSEDWSELERTRRQIPQYVLDYAPMVYLFSQEEYWPSDVADHLEHVMPYLNYTPLNDGHGRENASSLSRLNPYGWKSVYLQSDDDVETKPDWLLSKFNIPVKLPKNGTNHTQTLWESYKQEYGEPSESPQIMPMKGFLQNDLEAPKQSWFKVGSGTPMAEGADGDDLPGSEQVAEDDYSEEDLREEWENLIRSLKGRAASAASNKNSTGGNGDDDDYEDDDPLKPPFSPKRPKRGGRSGAPVILITADKGQGVVDAFWFFFYSYNLGNKVLNVRFGNHVGDWEHTAIRFQDGVPKAVFVSEHDFGDAYSYEAMEKIGKRPVVYVGTGTHAMYVTPGLQPYILPWGLLHDETDRGPLWDPLLNLQSFTLDYRRMRFRSSTLNPKAPVSWINFFGKWGDKAYPLNDHRQYRFAGQGHYVNGPLGPRFKNLGRQWICQGRKSCHLKSYIANPSMRPWTGGLPGVEMSAETIRKILGDDRTPGIPDHD